MSPRIHKRASVEKSKCHDYIKVANNFYSGAEAARAYEYWNAAGLLIVHAAIAYTAALTIKIAGVKSQGDDHMEAVDLVRRTVVLDQDGEKALNHLWRMIQEKNAVSYNGEIYAREDVEKLWKHLACYKAWALSVFNH